MSLIGLVLPAIIGHSNYSVEDSRLSYLSFFFKAPITNHDEYVVNSFSRQRETLVNLLKAAAGILPDDTTLMSFQF